MGKNRIKMNEIQLRKVIRESVKKVLKEGGLYPNGYEIRNLTSAWMDGDEESMVTMLKNMSEVCKKEFESITGTTVEEMLNHWFSFRNVMVSLANRYYDDDEFGYKERNPYL